MKKFILSVFLSPLFATAQLPTFTLTPFGLRNSVDTAKPYIVLSFPGKSARQLYETSFKYINETYKNPDLVTRAKTDTEYLRIQTHAGDVAVIKLSGGLGINTKYFISADYSIELRFKDEKVRFDIIATKFPTNIASYDISLIKEKGFTANNLYIYSRNLEVKHEDTRKQIEDYFNKEVTNYYEYFSKNKNDW